MKFSKNLYYFIFLLTSHNIFSAAFSDMDLSQDETQQSTKSTGIKRKQTDDVDGEENAQKKRKLDVDQSAAAKSVTALMDASAKGDIDEIKQIVEAANLSAQILNAQDAHGRCALHWAVQENQYEAVKFLLDLKSIDIDVCDIDGFTPLMLAIDNKNLEISKMLIDKNAEVNLRDRKKGFTPLLRAVFANSPEAVKLILDKNVNPTYNVILDNKHVTALDIAKNKQFKEVAQLIEEYSKKYTSNAQGFMDALLKSKHADQMFPYLWQVSAIDMEKLKQDFYTKAQAIFNAGIDFNASIEFNLPNFTFNRYNSPALTKLLVNPLHIAIFIEDDELVSYLINCAGVDINRIDLINPIFFARSAKQIKLLIDAGANIFSQIRFQSGENIIQFLLRCLENTCFSYGFSLDRALDIVESIKILANKFCQLGAKDQVILRPLLDLLCTARMQSNKEQQIKIFSSLFYDLASLTKDFKGMGSLLSIAYDNEAFDIVKFLVSNGAKDPSFSYFVNNFDRALYKQRKPGRFSQNAHSSKCSPARFAYNDINQFLVQSGVVTLDSKFLRSTVEEVNLPMVKFLLEQGVKDEPDDEGITALQYASDKPMPHIIQILKQYADAS